MESALPGVYTEYVYISCMAYTRILYKPLPGRRSGMGYGAEHAAEAHAAPNASADCSTRDHVAPDIGPKRPTGECHSDSTGAHTARDRADSLAAHDVSHLAAPCTGGHRTASRA